MIQAPLFDARSTPMLYEISTKGVDYLETLQSLPHRAVTFSRRSKEAFSPQFPHTMMIIETLLETELETIADPNTRFVPVDEVLARAPEATQQARNPLAVPVILNGKTTQVIPDALYGIEYENGFRFWALECERTSPAFRSDISNSSTARKRAAYAAVQQAKTFQTHWSIPNLDVRYIKQKTHKGQ